VRTTYCGLVSDALLGQSVTLMGWAHRRRDHGGVIFIDLRDREGLVQIVCDPDRPAMFATAEDVRNEFCLKVEGLVRARPAGTENANLVSGKVEVLCRELEVLNPSVTPPFQLDDENLSETTRLTHRVLDLRRPQMQKNMMLRYRVAMETRKFLDAHGFIDIETPMLTKSTPEGARDYLVPSRVNEGMFFALPQSPQLFKQLLMVAGFDRYYQITKCFRDEDLRADRQPEFTQIDIEASFVAQDDITTLAESLIRALWEEGGFPVSGDIARMTYADAMERYGIDRPDLRYGLEIEDVSEVFRGAEFGITQGALASGGRVRGIRIPGGASLSRKQQDEIEAFAKSAGAMGLIRLKRVNGVVEGPAAKFLAGGVADGLRLAEGELGLYVAAADRVSSPALDRVRQEVAQRLGLVPAGVNAFVWVTDFPMFERDPESGALAAVHHPFTAPHPDDLALLEHEPWRARALAYDLVLNGTELGGGSIRISDPALQGRILALLGIDDATAQARFGFLLEGLRSGAPPHGGIAFGFDRITMLLAGASSLRDVIAFPKTTAARALFEGAPTTVPAGDLHDLHIHLES
jgi:aspartyl-tRNA synthetase